jgi:hypothetical protein
VAVLSSVVAERAEEGGGGIRAAADKAYVATGGDNGSGDTKSSVGTVAAGSMLERSSGGRYGAPELPVARMSVTGSRPERASVSSAQASSVRRSRS